MFRRFLAACCDEAPCRAAEDFQAVGGEIGRRFVAAESKADVQNTQPVDSCGGIHLKTPFRAADGLGL